jgi:Uma2 family endonuclease
MRSAAMRPEQKREATYEDLVALPSNMIGQIIAGELIASPRPASDHAVAASALESELYGPFQRGRGGPGGWWLIFEPELHFGKDVLVPDVAGWRRTRMPSVPRAPFFTLPPDWVCEVLSPSTAGLDRVRKKHIYAREGVEYVWLVDPVGLTLETFQYRNGQWVELGSWSGNDRVRAEPFEAIELELEVLWLSETPPP